MNGITPTSILPINTIADLNWDIKGSGDFNADGKSDILWRNSSTGTVYLFTMNGANVSSIDFVTTIADQAWQVYGTGDYNGDGKADILWYNNTTGAVYLSLMNGPTQGKRIKIFHRTMSYDLFIFKNYYQRA